MTEKRQLEIAESLIEDDCMSCCGTAADCRECEFTDDCPSNDEMLDAKARKYIKEHK